MTTRGIWPGALAILLAVICSSGTVGCGQSGPLVLPERPADVGDDSDTDDEREAE